MMVADPTPAPVTCGCVAGVVAPAAIDTLAGTVTLDGSLLSRVTVSPPAGAACDKVTANTADCPKPTAVVPGTLIDSGPCTVTLAVVSAMFGRALAWITVEPAPTAVTGTGTAAVFAKIVTVAGTVAAAVLLELRLIFKSACAAAPDRFSVSDPALPTLIVRLGGWKLSVWPGVTCTTWLAGVKPLADAMMVADPTLTPVTFG